MGMPRSWAKIEFPARFLDADIQKELANYYGYSENGEPDIEAGIFTLEDGEAVCGEFKDLEAMLKLKGIPFDRQSAMDWECAPRRRVYRPVGGFDHCFDLDADADEPVVSVKAIRELLALDDAGEYAASAIRHYLDENFPAYPPLTDWAKEG